MHPQTERSRIKRGAKRACYDTAQIHDILDNNFLCHVGFTVDGEARVIPTAYLRIGDAIYLHGNQQNRMMAALLDGQTACITVTELNGLVLARSGLHHSVNYRSAIVFARAEQVADNEKENILNALIDHLVPGRSATIRPHLEKELDATLVLKLPILEAAAKIRQGPPVDAEADYELDIWAGVISLKTVAGSVEPCPRLPSAVGIPEHVQAFVHRNIN